jgi:hypothetical protein
MWQRLQYFRAYLGYWRPVDESAVIILSSPPGKMVEGQYLIESAVVADLMA